MSYLDAIILGLVQGVAEFLPISSDGHLVVVEHILGIETDLLALNIALHFGSLLAIIVVFRHDLLKVVRDVKLMTAIVVATLPLIPVALFLKDFVDKWAGSLLVAGCGLCVTAGLLLLSHSFQPREAVIPTPAPPPAFGQPASSPQQVMQLGDVSWHQALVVGLFQAVAIAPGVSRSGSTIVAGLMQGFPRDVAARFAFLIAIPAICGAVVFKAKDLFESQSAADAGPIAVGTLISFVVGVACLNWLIKLITQNRLHWFGWYCLIAGVTVIVWALQ